MLKNNGFHNRHSPFIRSFGLGTSLALDFTNGAALDPRITFSRTTNATVTGSNGLIQYAPHNLLTFSEQFDNAAWLKNNATVTANATVAPDGTLTADKLIATAVTSAHFLRRDITTATQATFSTYAKAAEETSVFIGNATGSSGCLFNLETGVATPTPSSTGTITPVGNGWFRCSVTRLVWADWQYISLRSNTTSPYPGDGTSGLFIWGAQLELGSTATTYNSTTVKNLLGFTEHFDNAAWTKSNATITSGFTDIYGQPFAQKLVEDTANSMHRLLPGVAVPLLTGTAYAYSVYAKAAERSICSVVNNVLLGATFDLATGQVTSVTSGFTASIESVGNGWYRLGVVELSTININGRLSVALVSTGTTTTYTGDGTSGIYIFGAQLSDSASVDPYVYNPVAAPASTAYYGPRFDYDPVTLAPKGLLIEEQRTQLLLNSSLAGTSLATQNVTVTAVAHTLSFYGTGTVTLSGTSTAGPLVGTGAYPARSTLTFTPTAGTLTLTVTGDVQFAQLEIGAFATSFIPSAASQVTRAADNASMIGNNFARWYNQTEGTVFAEASSYRGEYSATAVIWDGTLNNRIDLSIPARTDIPARFTVPSGGVVQADLQASGTYTPNTFGKAAAAYKENDFALSLNGATPLTDLSGTIPVTNRLTIGGRNDVNTIQNGHIARIAYYNRRLANTELTALTS
jgi:hypothetical protein